jgi:hypothetical protein
VPVGLVQTQDVAVAGPGDLALDTSQRLVGGKKGGWYLQGGVTAPTGVDGRGTAHSAIDLTPLEDGQLLVATYDTRASLSRGAWTARLGTTGRLALGPVQLGSSLDAQQPLHATQEGIRWGRDVMVSGWTRADPIQAMGFSVAGDGRWHASDQGAFIDTETGEPLVQEVGKRQSLGASAQVHLMPSKTTACTISMRTPLWQRSESIVLMEGVSGGVGCRIQAKAGRRAP